MKNTMLRKSFKILEKFADVQFAALATPRAGAECKLGIKIQQQFIDTKITNQSVLVMAASALP